MSDMCDREWQRIGHKEQFKSMRENLFTQWIQIVLQTYIEMIEKVRIFHGNPIPSQTFEAYLKSFPLDYI